MFKAAWSEANTGSQNVQSYEDLLKEYEKFFSLEEEINKKSSRSGHSGKLKGADVTMTLNISFLETI